MQNEEFIKKRFEEIYGIVEDIREKTTDEDLKEQVNQLHYTIQLLEELINNNKKINMEMINYIVFSLPIFDDDEHLSLEKIAEKFNITYDCELPQEKIAELIVKKIIE